MNMWKTRKRFASLVLVLAVGVGSCIGIVVVASVAWLIGGGSEVQAIASRQAPLSTPHGVLYLCMLIVLLPLGAALGSFVWWRTIIRLRIITRDEATRIVTGK